ncbi:DUF5134 domain-containing protein [Pseudonocardia sp. HH130629-09]|uniref:DUF5134 domain-containing protein n=1 Tax=Pseudonocardia sp. HH130629-09 TaxID=1641402 RepID=UPI000761462A|nr:DUF5134 domain-containing protein [Pseudonocardia sp. HH130629-09]
MISSLPLAWALTALFAATGFYALARWATAVSERRSAAHRTAELAHLLMSAAMIVMTWTWYGSAGLWTQIVLFGVLGVFFLVTTSRGISCGPSGRLAGAAHALMAAAMVWMLVAMPLIMASPAEAAGGGGAHAHHGGGDAMDMSGGAHAAGPAGWAVAVTVALCAVLLAAAGYWGARTLSHDRVAGDPLTPDDARATGDATDPAACDCADPAGGTAAGAPRTAPAGVGGTAETTGTAGTGGTTTAVAARVEAPAAPVRRLGARSDAACHAAMSLGMVVMLAAMVAGW